MIIGIDLGITNSAVAIIDQTGQPKIVHNKEGSTVTPCYVKFHSDGVMEVGEGARKVEGDDPSVQGRFKRDMGTDIVYRLKNPSTGEEESFTPEDLSAAVLLEMKRVAEAELGEIGSAVVTVPANFTNEQRESTMRAADKAGLKTERVINEPTAAALHYAFSSGAKLAGNYVIYDLGGGTFDVTVVNVDGDAINVLCSNGIASLGGDDFDKHLIDLVKVKFKDEFERELDDSDYPLPAAETDKITLSTAKKVTAGGGDLVDDEVIQLKRSDFEESISSMIAQTEMLCEATVEEAQLQMSDIQEVILVGGSTRIPAVKDAVKRVFGKDPVSSENPDEAVALGAALYSAIKSDSSALSAAQQSAISQVKVGEITNSFWGTISQNPETGDLQNSTIIRKNEPVPCSKTESFYTTHEGQTSVACRLTQSLSDETDPHFIEEVGEADLELPSGRAAGKEVQVTYTCTENGTIQCTFLDVESGNKAGFEHVTTVGSSESSNIDKFLVE